MNEELNVMEEVNDDINVAEMKPEEASESGKAIGLIIAGVVMVGALGALAYNKIKTKKSDKPRKRKKLMWVEIDGEDVADAETNDEDDVASEEE